MRARVSSYVDDVYMCVCVCVRACVCAHINVCLFINTYVELPLVQDGSET